MNCIVTAGPTSEPLDEVRRLTNASTGRLGTELANALANAGHQVHLLLGAGSTWAGPRLAHVVTPFVTTRDLFRSLETQAGSAVDAVFHAAAVSDFGFGRVGQLDDQGRFDPIQSPKFSTRHGPLLAELIPTPKIIGHLRDWHPAAILVGWKFEVEGDRGSALEAGRTQIAANRTDFCVVNGPAYGTGFGLVGEDGHARHLPAPEQLRSALLDLVSLR